MPLTWSDDQTKFQLISGDMTAPTLIQAQQDMNIGYKRFNAAIARYFTRKQQFADIVTGQQYYQIPVDAIRVSTVTVTLPNGYVYPVEEMKSEAEWRKLNIVTFQSTYASWYWVDGNDQLGLWPIPSTDVSAGLRYVYQPQDVDLTRADYTTGTVSVNNGSTTVTGVGTVWVSNTQNGMFFQTTDNSDGNMYEVIAIPNSTTLTLKTPYAGPTVSNVTYRLGQKFIFPDEYDDVPIDYALMRFFERNNNPQRAQYHKNNYETAVKDAVEKYASSTTSNVITSEGEAYNLWYMPPMPGS